MAGRRRSSPTPEARTAPVRFRPASRRDLPTLLHHRFEMWRDIGGRPDREIAAHMPRYRPWLVRRLRTGEIVGVMAESGRGVVGSGLLWYQPAQPRPGLLTETEAYILSMYTRPEFRGHGVASQIVRRLLGDARKRGMKRVLLHASIQGRPVYRRLGFERTWEMRFWLDARMARRRALAVRAARARYARSRRRRA